VSDIADLDTQHVFFTPVAEKIQTTKKKSPDDKAFFTYENMKAYDEELLDFARKIKRSNPYEKQRRAISPQLLWLQLDSKAFIESRVKGRSSDKPDSRIYLNPRYDDTLQIYKEIFTEAERQGLRFKSKVFDFTLRHGKKGEHKRAKLWEDYDSVRIDPMVFYGYEDSHDQLLQIVNGVYMKHQDSFRGRRIGAAPVKVASGFALGSEPAGLSGVESLTSHREGILDQILGMCSNQKGWEGLSNAQKKKLYCATFRANTFKGIKHNINPNNIAFDAGLRLNSRRRAA
jgi:hypothetical protein